MAEIILTKAPETHIKEAHFNRGLFEAVNEAHGYNIVIERALKCPCKSHGTDNLSSCRNCGGSGWIFINPTQTKSIIHSMNRNTQYKEWTEANLGQANFSFRDVNRIGFMDRISLLNGISLYNQTVDIKKHNSILFSFLDYNPLEIQDIFMFDTANTKLTKLTDSDYIINGYKIILNNTFLPYFENNSGKLTITISYTHRPQYHIIDINRDTMAARSIENKEDKGIIDFPISAIGRKAHYVINRNNFEGNLYLDNSYIDNCKQLQIGNICINAPIENISNCSNSHFGQVIYDIQSNSFLYYNGSVWINIGNSTGNQTLTYSFVNKSTFTVTHNLGRIVDVMIYNDLGDEIEGEITYSPNSLNEIIITFSTPQTGKIIVN